MADLPIISGQTERFSATFTDANGAPINLTGATVTLEGAAATVAVTDAVAGKVSVMLAAETTAAIHARTRVRFKRVVAGGDTALEAWFWLAPE